MANQNKLKAYVRYDGTGRVIAGGPILQRFKPAVGNWVEINANECCNSIPTTTTTTTQGGGVTPTAWITVIATTGFTTAWDACNGIGSTVVVYTSVSTITAGTYLYSDAALTTLIPYNVGSIAINGLVYDIVNGQINPLGGDGQPCSGITTTTTTTQTQSYPFQGLGSDISIADACNNGTYITLFSSSQTLSSGSPIYTNAELTEPVPYGYVSVAGYGYIVFDNAIYNEEPCNP